MKIIVINGQGGAGKDTFIDFCRKDGNMDIFVQNYSTVDFVKMIAHECGWKGEKSQKARKFLSDLKDAMTEYNNLPYYSVIDQIEHMLFDYRSYDIDTHDLVIFIHSREPKDINRWVKELGAKTLLIHRSSEGIFDNHADRDVYTIDYDYTIVNNGTLEELKEKAIDFINSVREEDWESENYHKFFELMQERRFGNKDDNDD